MSERAPGATTDFVVGLGKTGLSIARYLKRHELDARFYDTRTEPPGLAALLELMPDAEVLLEEAELPEDVQRIIASPGIADSDPLLTAALDANLDVISDIELFAQEANAPFIAVTGTNGKSTVTTLIYHMARAEGLDVRAGGNLGDPALDLLEGDPPDLYVLEVSSFQLHRTRELPAAVSVLLNVSPDHLDWHVDEDAYRRCKYRVYDEAKAAVYNREDAAARECAERSGHVVSFGLDEPGTGEYGIREEDGERFLARGETLLLSERDLAMFGRHNQANALAALAAGELAGFRMSSMLQVLTEFPGLPHRMQFIDRLASVDYVNDSKATNVGAAVASVESVEGMLVLIAGGVGKGSDYAPLAEALDDRLRGAVLIGEDAERIAAALDPIVPREFAGSMEAAVAAAAALAQPGDTVLLAPACASLDQYENYAARGDAFAAAVLGMRR
jgi:UDP-N-acetylmuramoylalanine--D-glutamate ligase